MAPTDTDDPVRLVANGTSTFVVTGETSRVETFQEGGMRFLLSTQERTGNTRTLNWSSGGRFTSVTDSYGRSLAFSYDLPNNSEVSAHVCDTAGRSDHPVLAEVRGMTAAPA